MTLLPQNQCCALLGIDPKTLRNWLRRAQMKFSAHPMDARFRCLTWEQVQALATLPSRPLASPCPPSLSVLPAASAASEPALPQPDSLPTTEPEPHESEKEAQLLNQLATLEPQVATLPEQRPHLTNDRR